MGASLSIKKFSIQVFFFWGGPLVSHKQVHAGSSRINNNLSRPNEKLIKEYAWFQSRRSDAGEKVTGRTEQHFFSTVKSGKEREKHRFQSVQLHRRTVSFKTSAP